MTVGMRIMGRGAAALVAAWLFAGPALAQDNFDAGKSGAQLYASNCAICHKSPQGLSKAGGVFGLESFLREHYTASRESAAAIAAYLNSVGGSPAAAERKAPAKKKARKKEEPRDGKDAKPPEKKPEEKPADKKDEKKDSGNAPHPKAASAASAIEG